MLFLRHLATEAEIYARAQDEDDFSLQPPPVRNERREI